MQQSTVVALLEHNHLLSPGEGSGGGDRQQVGFCSGVGEAYEVYRLEPFANELRQLHFIQIVGAKVEAARKRLGDSCLDERMRVSVNAGRMLSVQVHIAVPVGIGDHGAFAASCSQRKRSMIEDSARVAARHILLGFLCRHFRLGPPACKGGLRLLQRVVEIGIRTVEHDDVLVKPAGRNWGILVKLLKQWRRQCNGSSDRWRR